MSDKETRHRNNAHGSLHIGYPGTTGQPDGFQAYYTYYAGAGLIEAVTGSDLVEYARFTVYTPEGKIGQIVNQNGTAYSTSTLYTYDQESTRLGAINTYDSNQNLIQWKMYGYSQAGDIEFMFSDYTGYGYDYDGLHRLTEERTDGNVTATYAYSAIGNILAKTDGTDTYTYEYTHSTKKHAVTRITKNTNPYRPFNYDGNGNTTLSWDLSTGTGLGESLPSSYASKIGWKETTYPLENGNWVFVTPIREDCSVHFEVNPQGVIVGYKTVGNNCY